MISFVCQVCPIAERNVSAIHFSALNAGMRIDTKGFKMTIFLSRATTLVGYGW